VEIDDSACAIFRLRRDPMPGGLVSSDPMEMNPHHAAFVFAVCADRFYTALLPFAQIGGDGEPTLAGQFLYAGELDDEGCALLVAANVLGAASLTVTANPSVQRRAIRDGVVDFMVTTLDEALRILKNQLRKREPVAVCIAGKPQSMEREMEERGVQPDLVTYALSGLARFPPEFQAHARRVELVSPPPQRSVVTWTAETAAPIWLPKLDTLALECLNLNAGPAELAARRWLRLSPRYFGRLAQDRRIVSCDQPAAQQIFNRVQSAVAQGEIGAPIWITMSSGAGTHSAHANPPADSRVSGHC
jgi:urocanate hydratase